MDYIVKIVINDEIELFSKPYDSTDDVSWSEIPYISNPKLKDSTSLSSALAFGGMASNQLTFNIVNPDVEILENSSVQLFLKGADTGNLPQGNQRTDDGEFSIYVTQAETEEETVIDSDPDAVDLEHYGDTIAEVDEDDTATKPDIVLPDVYTDGEDEEPTGEQTSDDNPADPYYNPEATPTGTLGEDEVEELTAWSQIGGIFNVITVKQNNDSNTISVECLDAVASLSTDFYNPTTNGITADEMFDDLITQLSTAYSIDAYCSVDFPDIEITMPSNTTFRDALGYFAGLVGGFVTVDDYGSVAILPYDFSTAEVHGTDFIGRGFQQGSQASIIINGITCDTAVGREEDLITVYDGGDAWFENPFMTEDILRDYVWVRVRNLEYYSGTLECKWNTRIRAGQILKIYTGEDDARRNYLISQYEEASTTEEKLAIIEEIEQCGRYIINTNQTIDLVAGNTVISSLGQNKTQQTNTTKTKTHNQIQRTYSIASTAKSTADTAEQLATEANEIAVATGQHFWNQDDVSYFLSTDTSVDSTKTYFIKDGDTYTPVASPTGDPSALGYYEALGAGAYVTELDQTTFKQTPVQKNSLWNSAGMFFRDGLKNLLSILAGATKGIAIYDGEGNSSDNIVASFTGDGALIGKINETHVELADDSLEMYDGNEGSFAHIGRPTDQEITDTFSVETATSTFTLSAIPSTVMSIVIDDVALSSSDYTISGATLTITSPSTVPSGSIVVASYITNANTTYYTMGRRKASEGVGLYSMAEGNRTTASGKYAHAEGNQSVASGGASHAEGSYTEALGTSSHTEGSHTKTYGAVSHAEGYYTTTYATRTHAEGEGTHAVGYRSHAEGHETISQGVSAHAQNIRTRTGGEACTSMGSHTCATNAQSVSEGWNNIASGINSHVMGAGNVASRGNQLVMGYYNEKTVSSDTKTDTFDGTGKKAIFIPSRAVASLNSVTIDGVAITAYTFNENVLTFDTPPASGSVIEIVYTYYESNDKALIIAHGNSTTGADVTSVDWSGNIETSGNIASNGNVTGTNLWGSQTADLFCSGQFGGLTIITGAKACTHSATAGQETFAVSFGTTFKHLPNVQLTSRNARGNYIGDLTVAGLTTTGFNISIYSRESASHTYNISWFAIGERA